jgi:hypothetical protein
MESLDKIKQEFYILLANADIDVFFKTYKAKISKESSLYKEIITIEGSYNHYNREVRQGLSLTDSTKIASFLNRLRQIVDELQDSDLLPIEDYEDKPSELGVNPVPPHKGLPENVQSGTVLSKLIAFFLLSLLLWILAIILVKDEHSRKLLGKDCNEREVYLNDSIGITVNDLLEYKKIMSHALAPTELRSMLATVCHRMENGQRKDEIVLQYVAEIYVLENNLLSLSDEQFLAFFKRGGIGLKKILFVSFLYYLVISYLMSKISTKLGSDRPKMISTTLAFSALLLASMGIGIIWVFSINMNAVMIAIFIPIFLGLLGFAGKTIYEHLTTF